MGSWRRSALRAGIAFPERKRMHGGRRQAGLLLGPNNAWRRIWLAMALVGGLCGGSIADARARQLATAAAPARQSFRHCSARKRICRADIGGSAGLSGHALAGPRDRAQCIWAWYRDCAGIAPVRPQSQPAGLADRLPGDRGDACLRRHLPEAGTVVARSGTALKVSARLIRQSSTAGRTTNRQPASSGWLALPWNDGCYTAPRDPIHGAQKGFDDCETGLCLHQVPLEFAGDYQRIQSDRASTSVARWTTAFHVASSLPHGSPRQGTRGPAGLVPVSISLIPEGHWSSSWIWRPSEIGPLA